MSEADSSSDMIIVPASSTGNLNNDSSSPPANLKSRLEAGLQEMLSQVPPKYRQVLRLSFPHLQTSLRNSSHEQLTGILRGIRGMIDNLLEDSGQS